MLRTGERHPGRRASESRGLGGERRTLSTSRNLTNKQTENKAAGAGARGRRGRQSCARDALKVPSKHRPPLTMPHADRQRSKGEGQTRPRRMWRHTSNSPPTRVLRKH